MMGSTLFSRRPEVTHLTNYLRSKLSLGEYMTSTPQRKRVEARCVALTEDHWTSVNNDNYLDVTVDLIDASWEFTPSL